MLCGVRRTVNRRLGTALRLQAAALAFTLASGCSFLVLAAPKDPPGPSGEPRCSTSLFAPTADLVAAMVAGLAGYANMESKSHNIGSELEHTRKSKILFTVAAVELIPAIFGRTSVSLCRRRVRAWQKTGE